MMTALLLTVGGIVGALSRYYGARAVQTWWGRTFPLGTFAINISGCFALGLLNGVLAAHPRLPTAELALLLGIGFCGAYTTFSSFAFETIQQWQQGQHRSAIINLLAQPLFGGITAWLGLVVGMSVA